MSTTGWTYSSSTGTATVIDSTFRLTNSGTTGTATYMYYNTAYNMAGWCQWVAEYDFKISPSTGTIADGFAFWFLSSPPSTSTGASIGLPPNPNGIVLVFDTYDNYSSTPAHIPQISLMGYNGTMGSYVETSATGRLCTPLYIQNWIRDGNWHHVKMTYFLGNVNVYFDYAAVPSMTSTAPYLMGIPGYFGFSGSTGAITSTQLIKRVNIVLDDCLTPSNNGPLCEGDTLRLYATGDSSFASYSWYGPNGFSSTLQNPTRIGVTYADSGDYYVIKTFGGVPDTEMTHVSVKITPTVTATGTTLACFNGSINLNANPALTGETFSWSGPGGYTSAVQNPTRTPVTFVDTGDYTVITTLNGCHDTASTHVSMLRIANVWDSANSGICVGDTIKLYASDTTAGVSWSWSGPGGWSSVLQNPIRPGSVAANAGIYTVTASLSGCSVSDTILVTLNAVPTVPLIVPMTRICSGGTLNFVIDPTTTYPGATYHWSGPNGWTSTLTNPTIPGAITGNTGLYSVYAQIGLCKTTQTHNNFVVDSTPEVPFVSNSGPICSDSTLYLFSSDNTAGVSYNWSGPALYTSTLANPVIYNTTTSMSGNYTVTVTLGLCDTYAVTNVLIKPTPTNPVIGSNSPVCQGGVLNLNASFTPYTGIFHWSGPNAFTSLLQNPSIINVPLAASGTYYVYELLNGCTSDTVSTNVVINVTPAVPVATNNSPICEGDTLLLFATDATAGVTYSWQGPLSFASTLQNPSIENVTPGAGGIYTVTAILGNCSSIAATNVSITTTPTISATSNSPVCSGDTLKLTATAGVGNTFSWTGPYTFFASGPAPTRFPATVEYSGVYQVTTTEPGGCTATAYDTVIIKQTPDAPWITWLNYCQYDYAPPLHPVDATNVLWFTSSAPGGVGTATAPTPPTDVPGVYFYYLNQTVNGCTSPIDSIQVVVNPKPLITLAPADTAICPGDFIPYRASVNNTLASIRWTPSTYLSDSVGANVISRAEGSIRYFAIASLGATGCDDTAVAIVTVHPAALISIPVVDSVTLSPGETFHIEPISNCSNFNWFPPEGLSSPYIADPTANPEFNTMYIVTGTTENGCVAHDSIYFHVNPDNTYGVPNAFTPGVSGPNNTFKLLLNGVGKLNYFRIYNRWGETIFETKDVNEGWDGSYKGVPQPFGVYVYDIQVVSSVSGKIKNLRGNITLIR